MITLDQIRILEQKVEEAVSLIQRLKQENKDLTAQCVALEEEKNSLTERISAYEADQERIEQGIIQTLEKLNVIENSVLQVAGFSQSPETVQDTQSTFHEPQNMEENISSTNDTSYVHHEEHQSDNSYSAESQEMNYSEQNNFNNGDGFDHTSDDSNQYPQNGQLDIF